MKIGLVHEEPELLAELSELKRLNDSVEAFALSQHWPSQSLFQVQLALEEIVINVISYGAGDGPPPRIRIGLEQEEGLVSVLVADSGVPFDPLQNAPPDVESDIESRAVGGLGVHLVRELMDTVEYRRDGEWNKLFFTKTLPQA